MADLPNTYRDDAGRELYGVKPVPQSEIDALSARLTPMEQRGAAFDALLPKIDAIPNPPVSAPPSEGASPAVGDASRYAASDHVHARLTSATNGTLGVNAVTSVPFTRKFDSEPAVALVPIAPGGTQPVMLQVDSWLKDAANKIIGCIVKGYRLGIQNLTSVTVAGVSVSAGGQSVNVTIGNAEGVKFSCIALQPSG